MIEKKPPLTIRLCQPRGFCAGVDRAIQIVVLALKKYGAPVYVRHEIVHNRYVVEGLQSLGAVFIEAEAVSSAAEGAGGYARELAEEQQLKVLEAVGKVLPAMDLVITTAQIPGKPAPQLITADMVASMRPGAVIVDLAAESGGNCELTLAGETVQSGTTTIIGPVNVPATVPFHASQMFGKNVLALVTHLSTKEGALSIDPTDEITGAMTVVRDGAVVTRS